MHQILIFLRIYKPLMKLLVVLIKAESLWYITDFHEVSSLSLFTKVVMHEVIMTIFLSRMWCKRQNIFFLPKEIVSSQIIMYKVKLVCSVLYSTSYFILGQKLHCMFPQCFLGTSVFIHLYVLVH